jgi:5-methyltetrahydrofolate--homocysteine methyltransferase
MLSPEMFREFAMPGFREQTAWLDHSLYHWDGPGAIPHLDALLELPDLNAIQWVPGSGNPPVHDSEWFPLYRRIRDAGKGLLFTGARADTLEMLYKKFGPEGVMASCYVDTEAEGRRLLDESAKWL